MLNIENLSKSYGSQTLFEDANFIVGDQVRIGVVGPNGAGKSTFFRILVNEETCRQRSGSKNQRIIRLQ